MTETTEEKDIIAAIERCIEGDLGPAQDLSNGLHMTAKEAAAFGSWLNGELQDLEAQLTSLTKERDKAEEENKELKEKASSAINCLGEILEAAEEDPNSFLHVEFIQDISLEYGYLSRRCPTQEELADNEWWGHEYEIRADNCVVLDITLPDLQSKGEA